MFGYHKIKKEKSNNWRIFYNKKEAGEYLMIL